MDRAGKKDFGQPKPKDEESDTSTIQKSPKNEIAGEEPLKNNILAPENKQDLIYGIAPYRDLTLDRLEQEAQNLRIDIKDRIMIIDDYNGEVGIYAAVQEGDIYAIYSLRKALEDPENWRTYLPASQHDYPKPGDTNISNEQKWMKLLVENKEKIGLWDLGDKEKGIERIKSKRRFEKNLNKDDFKYLKDFPDLEEENLIKSRLHDLLSHGTNEKEAEESFEKNTKLPRRYKEWIEGVILFWIKRAFFRRTSKLGIDFATSKSRLNARIHFNLTSSTKKEDGTREDRLWGLEDDVQKDEGVRKISESELRYANRLLEKHKGEQDFEKRILKYSEYKKLLKDKEPIAHSDSEDEELFYSANEEPIAHSDSEDEELFYSVQLI